FLINGSLGFVPLLLLWEAQTLLVQVIAARESIALVASSIQLCITMTLATTAVFVLVSLVASVAPLPSVLRARRKYVPILVLLLMALMSVGAAIAFQARTSWMHQGAEPDRLFCSSLV